jgi:type VI secretion system protein ImpJ
MARSISIPDALRWYEGMLLAPHHFQQQAVRFESLLHYYATMATPFFWGVGKLEIDEPMLDNRVFRIRTVEAILPDGLLVTDAPADLDLGPYKADAERRPLRVYLCVPEASAAERQGAMARYVAVDGTAVADSDPEADEAQVAVPIPRLKPNARLVCTEAGTAGMVRMPVGEVEWGDTGFRLTQYVPPHPKIAEAPWCKTVVEVCQDVARRVREKANFLVQMIRAPVGSANRPQFERQLYSLMAALPEFEAHLATGQVHPYTLFVSLCTLAANVAAVGSVDEIPRFPRYDHDSTAEIFLSVGRNLLNTLEMGVQENYTEFRFDGEGHNFSIAFREEWIGRKLVLGILGQPTPEMIAWAEDCYIGTESYIEAMSKNRDIGAARVRDDQHEGLRRRPGTILYTVEDRRCIEAGETLYVYNPVKGPNDPAPARVLLYVKHESEQ